MIQPSLYFPILVCTLTCLLDYFHRFGAILPSSIITLEVRGREAQQNASKHDIFVYLKLSRGSYARSTATAACREVHQLEEDSFPIPLPKKKLSLDVDDENGKLF
jgi:hypothetical protein